MAPLSIIVAHATFFHFVTYPAPKAPPGNGSELVVNLPQPGTLASMLVTNFLVILIFWIYQIKVLKRRKNKWLTGLTPFWPSRTLTIDSFDARTAARPSGVSSWSNSPKSLSSWSLSVFRAAGVSFFMPGWYPTCFFQPGSNPPSVFFPCFALVQSHMWAQFY